ncbi:MAG: ABC transporter ATP-binding protein [Planctomycetota bacterium]|nr:MAG: ABC transporter ATP-binding protein [Planctomycetota bacterium]
MNDHDVVLRTLGLTKTYTDFWGRPRVQALQPLTLQVGRGQVYGLLGPNGSGKTTTIKLLLGLLQPTAGNAFVFGRSPGDRGAQHRLGYLPEETYLYRFLNATETLAFYGRLFGLDARTLRERSDRLIDQVGLGHARNRRLGEYSKGMARRLGLAQALINDPDLVILDEPTSGLDPLGTAEVKDLIVALKEQGKTVLLCSHLLADVEDVCDRIAILYRGRLCEEGAVEELLVRSNQTVLTLDQPDEELLAGLRQRLGSKLLAEEHPRERLEHHFRHILQQADAQSADPTIVSSSAAARSEGSADS